MKWSLLLVLTLVGVVYVQGDTTTSVQENDNMTPDTTTTMTPGTAITSAVFCIDKKKVCDFLESQIETLKALENSLLESQKKLDPKTQSDVIKRLLKLLKDVRSVIEDMEKKKEDLTQDDLKSEDYIKCLKKWKQQYIDILEQLEQPPNLITTTVPKGESLQVENFINTTALEISQDELMEMTACLENIN